MESSKEKKNGYKFDFVPLRKHSILPRKQELGKNESQVPVFLGRIP